MRTPLGRVVPGVRGRAGGSVAAAAQGALAPAAGPTLTASGQSFDLAIAPFVNLGQRPDDDRIGERIAEALASAVRARGRTLTPRTTLAAGGDPRGPDAAVEAGNDSRPPERAGCPAPGARAQVGGGYERISDRVHVMAQVVDVATGEIAHRTRIDGSAGDLLALLDRLVSALADGLAAPSAPVPAPVTGSLAFKPVPRAGADDRAPAGTGETAAASPAPESRVFGAFQGTGQGIEQTRFTRDGRRRAVAVWTSQPPRIDGRLDDTVWSSLTPLTGFVQTSPVEGAPPRSGRRSGSPTTAATSTSPSTRTTRTRASSGRRGRSATREGPTTAWRCCSTRSAISNAPTCSP